MISGCRASEAATRSPIGWSSTCGVAIQSFSFCWLPSGGPVTCQPSSGSASASNEVLPSPVETVTSSTKTPVSCTTSSLA